MIWKCSLAILSSKSCSIVKREISHGKTVQLRCEASGRGISSAQHLIACDDAKKKCPGKREVSGLNFSVTKVYSSSLTIYRFAALTSQG